MSTGTPFRVGAEAVSQQLPLISNEKHRCPAAAPSWSLHWKQATDVIATEEVKLNDRLPGLLPLCEEKTLP